MNFPEKALLITDVEKRFQSVFKSLATKSVDEDIYASFCLAIINNDFLSKSLIDLSRISEISQSSQMLLAKLMAESKSVEALHSKVFDSGEISRNICFTALKVSKSSLSALISLVTTLVLEESVVTSKFQEAFNAEATEIVRKNVEFSDTHQLSTKIDAFLVESLSL